MKRYELAKPVRFYTAVAIVIVIIATLFAAGKVYAKKPYELVEVVVTKGDTLWSIAEECNSETEIRELIYEIKEINNIGSNDFLFEGMVLYVPGI